MRDIIDDDLRATRTRARKHAWTSA